MLDKKDAIKISVIVIGVIYLVWKFKGKNSSSISIPNPNSGFYTPYTDWNNGIYNSPQNMNGSNTAFPPIDVTVNVPQFGQLANQYFPIYGFTGVVAMG